MNCTALYIISIRCTADDSKSVYDREEHDLVKRSRKMIIITNKIHEFML